MTTQDDDRRDYQVMLARSVYAERAWRIHGREMKPADFVARELVGRDFRRELEETNGEPLA